MSQKVRGTNHLWDPSLQRGHWTYVFENSLTKIAIKTGLAGLDEDKMKLVQDLEIEMMTDMYSRLSTACQKKVIVSYPYSLEWLIMFESF